MQTSLFEREVDKFEKMRPLRPRQFSAIASVRDAIREGHKHIGLQAPPGFGKTHVSAHIIAAALRKGSRPLFTAPAISLIDQTLEAFEHEGIYDIGVMQADHPRTNRNASVQIASVQTLIRRQAPDADFALIDEFHENFDGLNALLDSPEWANRIVIGLSATPWTRGLGLRYTKLIIGATFRDMMADGLAREYPIFGPPKDIDRGALTVSKGEFEEGSAAAAMSDNAIVGDVLTEWKERSTREKTFAFCVNRDHAKAQMEAFLDAGIPFGYIDANTPPGVSDSERGSRKYIFKQMAYGEIAGIASVGCLIRGVDEIVYTILDLAPTRSEIRHVQKWGRMRTSDPNATYIGLDHAGNNHALGLFTDIFHDHLDMRKPGERGEAYKDDYQPAKPRKCQKCHNLIPPGARACPVCKERVPLNPGVTVVDGRLVEIGSGPKVNMKERQEWYSGLLWIARKGNLKDGFAAYSYREKFGEWPKGLKVRGRQPSDEVKEFVKQRRKEYLSSRDRRLDDMRQAVAASEEDARMGRTA
jgi:superfamily II DNA or RNA helicase